MIHPRDIRAAEHIIDTSRIVEILLDGRRRSRRGRKTKRDAYRLFLIGGFLNVHTRGNFVIEDIHTTLTQRLPLDEQFRLGIRRHKPEGDDTTSVQMLSVHDLYNVSKALGKDLDYGHGSAPDLAPDERDRRHRVVRDCCDALMDVFDTGAITRTYAIDATGIWSWGKGTWRSSSAGNDPDDDADPQ